MALNMPTTARRFEQWYRARPPREQWILRIAAVVVPLLLLYVAVWDPLMSSRARLAKELPLMREAAARLSQQSDEVERLRGRAVTRDSSKSPRAAIEASAARLSVPLQSVETAGADRTTVQMGNISFDTLSRLIGDLASSEGLAVESLQLTAAGEGVVKVDRLIVVPATRRSAPAPSRS